MCVCVCVCVCVWWWWFVRCGRYLGSVDKVGWKWSSAPCKMFDNEMGTRVTLCKITVIRLHDGGVIPSLTIFLSAIKTTSEKGVQVTIKGVSLDHIEKGGCVQRWRTWAFTDTQTDGIFGPEY